MVGRPPSGLNPPPWWHAAARDFQPSGEFEASGWGLPPMAALVSQLRRSVASAGVMAASINPEHALLYRIEALD